VTAVVAGVAVVVPAAHLRDGDRLFKVLAGGAVMSAVASVEHHPDATLVDVGDGFRRFDPETLLLVARASDTDRRVRSDPDTDLRRAT